MFILTIGGVFFVDLVDVLINNKFALLWVEAQLCLPYVCLWKKVMTFSDPMVTYSHPKKVTLR